ncbi:MAG: hypothetical protein KF730_03345 [Sphingomonas sp.]|uniref:beta strand repeat-containing protein n=1 Tax=Sphingomonas sp. TaxID=28214 RepID=UPI0025F66D5E|nr:hypothetical protein [Sphingomonas sp.]MBX3563593.1 hypothetical protein [Sphingomonas sp.]
MIPKSKTRACKSRLLSGAGAALALALAALPAHAQAVSGQATGDTVLTNAQSAPGGLTAARGDGATIQSIVAGPLTGSTVALDRNTITATARANAATQTLAPPPSPASPSRSTSLTAGTAAIDAQANTLIANQQRSGSAEAVADIELSPISIAAHDVLGGALELTDNAQSAAADGNAATATIAVTGEAGDGAGIVSTQVSGPNSGVAARVRRGVTLDTDAITGTSVNLSGNSNDADAASNAVANMLSVSGGAIEAPRPAGFASRVPAIGEGDPSVSAGFGVLSNEQASGVIKARAGNLLDGILDGGPAIVTRIGADASAASLISDGNTVSASANGNRSANGLSLTAADISTAPGGNGAIGTITNVQSAAGAVIVASAHGGVATDVAGQLDGSSLSISQNVRDTRAIGNEATSNRLTVDAATSEAGTGAASNNVALVGPNGDAFADAGFTVQNVQDNNTASLSNLQAGSEVRARVGGALLGSTVDLTGNSGAGNSIGNSAANAAKLAVTTLETSAAVNNVQSGNGSVTSTLGTLADPGGVLIAPAGDITGSTLTVAANSTTGSAIGNAASNALDVTAATVRGNGAPAVSGAVETDYGARGTLVLANNQKLGQMSVNDALTPTIASDVATLSGVVGGGTASGSTIQVAGNRQRSEALGNSAGNRLTLSASELDDAGAALSSSQYGQANIAATSDFSLGAHGDLTDSASSLTGNSNIALGVVNDATNALQADGATDGTQSGAFASSGPLGPPMATGGVALANQQFATGSAHANAISHIGDVRSGESISGSRFTVDGNTNVAESAGNRVANMLTVEAAAATDPGSALANSQTNMAQVGAAAISVAGYALTQPATGPVDGSTISITGNAASALARGNAAENAMTIAGLGGAGSPASANLRDESVQGSNVLLNGQANYGAVTASADGSSYRVPLNASAAVTGSSITLGGNAIQASAYGNSANNSVALTSAEAAPGVGIANVQTNYGGVTALLSAAPYQITTGAVSGSTLSMTGNSLAATAVGNQATSVIASPR